MPDLLLLMAPKIRDQRPRWERDLAAGRALRGDTVPIVFSNRFIRQMVVERHIMSHEARRLLSEALPVSPVSRTPPDWYRPDLSRPERDFAYLDLGYAVAPLYRRYEGAEPFLRATTYLNNGETT